MRCDTCAYGDWVVKDPPCKECIGFSKWDSIQRNRKPVEPVPAKIVPDTEKYQQKLPFEGETCTCTDG